MTNPLLEPWDTEFGLPPFEKIGFGDFMPAFETAMAHHRGEIEAIARNPDQPSFSNVIEALELSGNSLQKVGSVFFNLVATDGTDELQAIQREISPKMASHYSAVYTSPELYARVSAVDAGNEDLDSEQARVLEKYQKAFVRAGAALDEEGRARMAELSKELASLGTQFGQNILADEKDYALFLERSEDLAGLPSYLRDAAAEAARARGRDGVHAITLQRSLIEPFLQTSTRRDLREEAFKAWIARGENPDRDNRPIVRETLRKRQEKARLLGFDDFAAFKLEDSMAKNAANVRKLLNDVWTPAKNAALAEKEVLQEKAQSMGDNEPIQAWDWRFYSERVRKDDYALDEEEIKPFFSLDAMIQAAFDTASRLFGLRFVERKDLNLHHADARAFDVQDAQGHHVGLFIGDYFARSTKRSGAWMSGFRRQQKLKEDIRPIVINVMNFAKANPALLSFDDARTLFHEFGHALHGLLSDVTYPMLSGTAVVRDFVELPSQLFEHWLMTEEILKTHARHYLTGETIPDALIKRILAAQNWGQGFAATEFIGSAMTDIDLHDRSDEDEVDPVKAETETRAALGMPDEIVFRHRIPQFAHIFSGDGYASGYYSYLWSEVMDADAFAAFEETGDPFDAATASRLKTFIYSAGNRQDAADAYKAFRGAMPSVEPLLEKRGFKTKAA